MDTSPFRSCRDNKGIRDGKMLSQDKNTGWFRFAGWRVGPAANEITFNYDCSRYGTFEERIAFPGAANEQLGELAATNGALLDFVHAVLGVSYYKAAASRDLILGRSFSCQAEEAALRALYSKGLGEFYVRNGLPYPPDQRWKEEGAAPTQPARKPLLSDDVLLAHGGGKDSLVAADILSGAGLPFKTVSVTSNDRQRRVLQHTGLADLLDVKRTIDPHLLDANRQGALNGHVPISAINSALLTVLAALRGSRWVVFANEASAEEESVEVGGHRVNHQYSKTLEWERLFQNAIGPMMPEGFCYFSLLRPVSEIWIARRLSQRPALLNKFISCNRNFTRAPNEAVPENPWCGACAKCAFTELILAPFLGPEKIKTVFGHIMLQDTAHLALYEEMAGLDGHKPWDCVGAVDEVQAVFGALSTNDAWAQSPVVQKISAKLAARNITPGFLDAFLTIQTDHTMPPEAYALLR